MLRRRWPHRVVSQPAAPRWSLSHRLAPEQTRAASPGRLNQRYTSPCPTRRRRAPTSGTGEESEPGRRQVRPLPSRRGGRYGALAPPPRSSPFPCAQRKATLPATKAEDDEQVEGASQALRTSPVPSIACARPRLRRPTPRAPCDRGPLVLAASLFGRGPCEPQVRARGSRARRDAGGDGEGRTRPGTGAPLDHDGHVAGARRRHRASNPGRRIEPGRKIIPISSARRRRQSAARIESGGEDTRRGFRGDP